MIEFGKTLQTAREAKGYTVGQLADMTKMMSSVISALENEDFRPIAAPIYGRGFVRLYCEAVGLDPKPLVDEFMEIMNGNRTPAIRERVPAKPLPEPVPVPAPPEPDSAATEPPRPDPQPDLFNPSPDPVPPAECQPLPSEPEPAEPEPIQQTDISRYSTPFQQTRTALPGTPPPWRIIVLALAALVVLGLVLFGIRALYRATSPAADAEPDAPAETAAETAQPVPAAPADKTPRTQQKIPALYID